MVDNYLQQNCKNPENTTFWENLTNYMKLWKLHMDGSSAPMLSKFRFLTFPFSTLRDIPTNMGANPKYQVSVLNNGQVVFKFLILKSA